MLKEFLDTIAARLNPIEYEHVGSRSKYYHKDYVKDDSDRPLNYRPEIARSVINNVKIVNVDDFVQFVNEYKQSNTKLFFSQGELRTVFNFTGKDEADYGDSQCLMPVLQTSEFCDFTQAVKNSMSQKAFVRFLKKMEPFIVKIDGKASDTMDIIEIAEHLQAVKKVDSIQRNTQQKFIVDAEVRTGRENFEIPRFLVFEIPVFENKRELLGLFEVELFVSADEGEMSIDMPCYQIDTTFQQLLRSMVDEIKSKLEIPSFQTT